MSHTKAYYAIIPAFLMGTTNMLFGKAGIDGLDILAIVVTVLGIMVYLYLTPREEPFDRDFNPYKIFSKQLTLPCPSCDAGVGELCVENNGVWVHALRFRQLTDYEDQQ